MKAQHPAVPRVRALSSRLLLLTLLFCQQAGAKPSIEAAQLDYVALDTSVECNRILFQSSQHFKRTLFVMPRVVPGTGVERSRTYSIVPSKASGFYDLSIHLYFPANDEVVKTNAASTFTRDLHACNWDAVKHAINKTIQDPLAKIQTISRIPLTSIEMSIPGIQSIARVGRSLETSSEVDILDYYGRSLTARFQITEAEKDYFQSQLVSPDGISAALQFRFQARSREGSVQARVDTNNLVAQFSSNASIKGMKFISSAQLTAALKSSLNETSIQITSEGGNSSETVAKIAALVTEKILQEVSFLPAPSGSGEKAKAETGGIELVSVAAVLDIVKTKVSSQFSFNQISAPENATAQTQLKLQSERLNDPNISEVTVAHAYLDPSLGHAVTTGQSITINAAYSMLDNIEYKEQRRYVTTGDITRLELGSYFPDILDQDMAINDVEINGTLLAQGSWSLFGQIPSPNKYRWYRIRREANRLRDSSDLIPQTREGLAAQPIAVSFSELGDRRFFRFSELLKSDGSENPYFSTLFDPQTGRLIITAKQNLGTVRFRALSKKNQDYQIGEKKVVLEEVVEEKIPLVGARETVERRELRIDEHPLTMQKSIMLYVGNPRVFSAAELESIRNNVGAKVVAPAIAPPP